MNLDDQPERSTTRASQAENELCEEGESQHHDDGAANDHK